MRKVSVKHHKQKGCFQFVVPILLCSIVLYAFKIPILSTKALIYGIVIYLLVFKGIPLLLRLLINLNIFGKIPEKISSKIPARKTNDEIFSINGETKIINPYAGVFISGGAGSGKSKSLIEPVIKEAGNKDFTGVIYDFKFPELAEYVETAYKNSDVARYYFNFDDLSRSNKINPIAPDLMTKESFAREFAYSILVNLNPQMISKPDFWTDNATSLLSATFWYLREKHPSYCTLPHAISMILQPNLKALLRELCEVPKCADMIASILTAFDEGASQQLAGVISSLQVSLSKININEIYYLMSESDFSLELNDSDKKGILTIGNSPQLSSTYAPLIGLILTSVSKQLNRQGKEKSVFIIDEFPTVYIPNVEQLPATARSNKVVTVLACQDIAQLSDKYGKEKTETILSNLGNQFYGRTPNPQTAKRVSDIFGKAEQIVESKTINGGILSSFLDLFSGDSVKNDSRTISTRETDIVKSQDVASLDTGTFFTILSEGEIRQGISQIPIDKKFNKTELKPFNNVTEDEILQSYERVQSDVMDVIFKGEL